MKTKKKNTTCLRSLPVSPVCVIYLTALCFCGGFHEYVSAAVSAALSILLISELVRQKQLRVSLHPVNLALYALPFAYLAVCLWAVDRGYAVLGFVKFLPVSLFTLLLVNRKQERERLFSVLPYTAAIQTVLSAVLMQLPALRRLFSVSGRLAGFFQYPNTFAIFLLLAILVILTKEKISKTDLICLPVLAFGILYSGSRTAAVLTAVFVLAALFTNRSKKLRLAALLSIGALAAAAAVYTAISGNYETVGRFLRISLSESTLVGRVLYWKDGLRLLARRPFGLGYMGWNFTQYANQTGVYAVQFIHNDYLQLLLDIGIPGFLPVAAAAAYTVFSKKTDRRRRLMLLALGAHLFMDFDLQFLCVALLGAALLLAEGGKEIAVAKKAPAAAVCALLGCVSLLPGLSQGLYHFGNPAAAAKVWPYNTFAATAVVQRASGTAGAESRANALLKQNAYVTAAWSELAKAAMRAGDAHALAEYAKKAIDTAPYDIGLYDDYCYMLSVCYGAAAATDDRETMRRCREEALMIPDLLEALRQRTDGLAYKTDDLPQFTLSEAGAAFIEKMRQVDIS